MTDYLIHHGIPGQKWGVRRYQNPDGTRTAEGKKQQAFLQEVERVKKNLTNKPKTYNEQLIDLSEVRRRGKLDEREAAECAELSRSVFSAAAAKEPSITSAVVDAVASAGGKMYGLEHRLKQPTSIAAKIGSDAKEDGVSFSESAKGIKDAIRYTSVASTKNYVQTYMDTKTRLEESGFREVKCKNYFEKFREGKVMHKAVQCTYADPTGYEFELQFQTPQSQAAKELKIPIYEERRRLGNTPQRNKELEHEMVVLANRVPDPPGVFSIESYKSVQHGDLNQNELCHHGVLGQKWGVRRYRNEDGTRTTEGKARRRREYKDMRSVEERALDRYSGPLNAADAKWVKQRDQQLRKAGIKTGSDGNDRIFAGSKMTRFTTNPSETDDRPKYVSLAKVDRTAYRKMADDGALGGKKEEPVYEMTLTAVDDLRVANGKVVADHIIDRYGDETLKSKWTTYNAMKIPDNYDRIFKDMTRNKNRKDVGQYAFQLRRDVFDGLQKALYTNKDTQQEILDYYVKKGYDAIVDAEDWAGGFTYPVIVMNTGKLKTTHVNRRRSK